MVAVGGVRTLLSDGWDCSYLAQATPRNRHLVKSEYCIKP
jgi:hypothetical protein